MRFLYIVTMVIALYLEPILDPKTKEYINVLTLDTYPEGPLRDLVKQQRLPSLSEFKAPNQEKCKYTLMHEDRVCYLTKSDIPYMFSYLRTNGYTIDRDLTKLYKHEYLVCIFYGGVPSP